MITPLQVREALRNRHAGPSWAFFEELRTMTGIACQYKNETMGCLDAYVAGLWVANRGFIAYEIKNSRGDFMSDVEQFASKQASAMRNSTQFYYVCPANLIRPDEVPESTGLIWVDGGGCKAKKVAQFQVRGIIYGAKKIREAADALLKLVETRRSEDAKNNHEENRDGNQPASARADPFSSVSRT